VARNSRYRTTDALGAEEPGQLPRSTGRMFRRRGYLA
jgi:hypothetical protein